MALDKDKTSMYNTHKSMCAACTRKPPVNVWVEASRKPKRFKASLHLSAKRCHPNCPGAAQSTFDHGEHSARLVQWDGETQGLQVLLLMEQVGQLLLPSDTTKHTNVLNRRLSKIFGPQCFESGVKGQSGVSTEKELNENAVPRLHRSIQTVCSGKLRRSH